MQILKSRTVVTCMRSAIAIILIIVFGTFTLSAQELSTPDSIFVGNLKVPNSVFLGAAAADWVSTYQFLQRGARETNPMLSGLQSQPALMIATGAAIDVASLWAWNRYVGKKHPRLAAVGLYTAAALRVWVASRNHGLNRR